MLPEEERLRRASLFKRAYATRKFVALPAVTLYVLPRQERSQARMPFAGFVVSKKVHSRATERNRSKRRVREAYRRVKLEKESLKQWYAVVWLINEKAAKASWDELVKTISDAVDKADKVFGKTQRKVAKPE